MGRAARRWHHRRCNRPMECRMPQPNDLGRSLVALDQDSTLIAVIEMGQASWLIAAIVPGLNRHPLKKIAADEEQLLQVLRRWKKEAETAGRMIKRTAVAYEAGRDGFWLARWLGARGIEAYVIHPSSVPVSRDFRRAKTDRLDTELLKRAFLGWLRGEPDHCTMAAIPTLTEEDAKRPGRERESLVGERTRIISPPNEPLMADQIVITEKTSQAKDIRAAVGSRYGDILPAEGHLLDLLEPQDVVPAWKRWSPILLRPEGLYGTRPAEGGNKAAKLKAIREALRTAKRVWLATDCDREGQLIGQEILEHYEYRGQIMRVLFTAQDLQTIRDAFGRAKPNAEYSRLYAAAVARRQADQIYNLSLTRTATVILGQGARRVIGVGRVKTPTLAIVCRRELEIRNFVPLAYFEVVATAKVAGGQFQMRHAPQERIVRREIAQAVANAAQGFEGTLDVRLEDKRQGPPKLHDLPSLQKLCGSQFGWPASKTLDVAQEQRPAQSRAGQ